ncbi:ECF transporter S component [Virgibacillus sp. W0430]|uniref:ECF transporter S component n=1 Tax=Virgibacillus sp. W0430 TaxID=3391580 RepID=UPI003F46D2B7
MIYKRGNKKLINTYWITLLAILASLSVAGRYFFALVPNVQPVTTLIILCGFFLGPVSAILLAITTTFLSNMLLGMGIWSIWQAVAWGIIGFISGLLGSFYKNPPLILLIIYASFCGYLYGFIISLATYQIAGRFWPYYVLGLPFDTSHAIGNAIFMVILHPILSLLLKKYFVRNLHP